MFSCRIVGDNWDLEVKARYQTKSQTNKSLHYFHAYAVKDRVVANGMDNKEPQKSIDEIEMQEFLPTPEVQEAIASDLTNIIPRVISKYLKPYNKFKGASTYHTSTQERCRKNQKWYVFDNYCEVQKNNNNNIRSQISHFFHQNFFVTL